MSVAEKIDYALFCEAVALKVWGKPSDTSAKELRWGTHGSRALDRRTGRWFDHEVNEGGSTVELLSRELGLDFKSAVEWLRSEGHLGAAPPSAFDKLKGSKTIVATYDYVDEFGELLFQVVRFEPKTFRQRRPDGQGGWIWSIKDVRPVLYRLPEVMEAMAQARPVFIVEGEKDADNLAALGIQATTNAGGASKWRADYSKLLHGGDVILVADNDGPGREHMRSVAASLAGVASRVRVLDLAKCWPACPDKGDISNWIEGGGTSEALWAMCDSAIDWDQSAQAGQDPTWRDNIFTAAALKYKEFPPLKYVVPDVIPEGLSILAGRPKLGKSWMALDICIAVAGGTYCLGDKQTTQGDVLYCALEDNPRRLKRRISKVLSAMFPPWPERLTLSTSWRRLDQGGSADLKAWIASVPDPRLIVLDTLAGIRPIKTNNGYTEDYGALEALHKIANELGIGIMVLHHTRKMEAEDPLDTVSGTLGLAGCADAVMVLNRNSQGTTLYVRGRDVEEAEHAVTFDKTSCRWSILGNASEVHRSNERGRILAALEAATVLMSPQEIVAMTGMPRNNVDQLLFKMCEAGEITKIGRGKYRHPDRVDLDPR